MASSKAAETAVAEIETRTEAIEAHAQEVSLYLEGRSYDPERLVEEIEFYHQQHVSSAFEVGRRLVVLKANLEHGSFVGYVLTKVGITDRYARQLMAFARTVVEASAVSKGRLDFDKLSSMSPHKVVLLGELIEESPEELEERGTIGGRNLDEWDAMSRDQLKREVKALTQKIEVGQQQLQETKDKLLNERDRVEQLLSATPNAVAESVTRLGERLRDSLASFEATAECDDELEPDSATILDLVGLKSQLRTFYDRLNQIIDERFPAVLAAEVPTDVDLTAAPTVLDKPSPARKRKAADVVDAQ